MKIDWDIRATAEKALANVDYATVATLRLVFEGLDFDIELRPTKWKSKKQMVDDVAQQMQGVRNSRAEAERWKS